MDYINTILTIVKRQFEVIKNLAGEDYKVFNIVVDNEQIITKKVYKTPNNIFVCVNFGSSSLDLGLAVFPITLKVLGENNGLEVAQKLLLDYANKYTQLSESFESENNKTFVLKQIYQTPSVMSNFNEVWDGLRTLFVMSGSILIGENALPINRLGFTWNEETNHNPFWVIDSTGKETLAISYSDQYNLQIDAEATGTSNDFAKSWGRVSTFGFSVSMFMKDNYFINKCLDIKFGDAPNNTIFDVWYKFSNAQAYRKVKCIMISFSIQQNKTDFPVCSITFAFVEKVGG